MRRKYYNIDLARQGKRRSAREQAVFLYLFIVFVLVSIHLDRGNEAVYIGKSFPLSDNWVTESNEVVSLYNLPIGSLYLTTELNGLPVGDNSLLVESVGIVIV